MPIIRKQLKPSDVYPEDIRYNEATDTVQSFINGSWVDNPQADPRTQTTFPPRLTSDPACDAAQSVVDALIGQINGIIEAIDNASTLFTIAGIILSIFTFGAYAIFISLALGIGDQMVGFGSAAIEAALTSAVYDTLKCILKCHMDAQGRIKAGEFGFVQSDVDAQIGGIGATILNAMLSLAGEGGVNNLASLGTSTGNCAACDCTCDCTAIWVPYPAAGGGATLVSQDGCVYTFDSETVATGGNYYMTIWTEVQNDGCCMTAQQISGGTINGVGYTETGDPDVALVPGTPSPTTSVWIIQYRADAPFRIAFNFSAC